MWDALKKVEERYDELTRLLSTHEVASDARKLRDFAKERAGLDPTIRAIAEHRKVSHTLKDDRDAVASGDPELAEMAHAEIPELEERVAKLEEELKKMLLPRDPADDKNVIIEVRAGTGGDEASLFAAELYRMYSRFAERRGWRQEVLTSSDSEVGVTGNPGG